MLFFSIYYQMYVVFEIYVLIKALWKKKKKIGCNANKWVYVIASQLIIRFVHVYMYMLLLKRYNFTLMMSICPGSS